MDYVSLFLVAVGLAMDCVAVSIVAGISVRKSGRSFGKTALTLASVYGGFQAAMLIAGYFAGTMLVGVLQSVDHWVAFGLLAFLGGKMIYEAITEADEEEERGFDFSMGAIAVAGIATSLDSLGVGLSYSLLGTNLAIAATIVGAVSFLLTMPAVFLGARLGELFAKRAEILGGVILIGIGFQILWEHLR